MIRRCAAILALVLVTSLGLAARVASDSGPQAKPADAAADKPQPGGWTIPPDADQKKSPLTVDAKVLAQGQTVFKSKCQKCHGAKGLGDGPDADPDHREDMDLTVASRAAKNSDSVVFYKVSNGRKRPKMTAFKDELSEEQIWTVVAYAQSLRKK